MDQSSQSSDKSPDTAPLAARIAALETKVEHLHERQRIVDVYRRYTRGLNRYDLDLLNSAFWLDAQINYGAMSLLRDDWIRQWKENRYLKGLSCQAHHITNEAVDIDGDVAHVESYLIAFWRPPQDGGSALVIGGRYIDRVDRRNGEWRIAVREFIPHFWSEANSVFNSLFNKATWPPSDSRMGADLARDLCYLRPLTPRPSKNSGGR